jgi:hypothetical protein
MTWRMFFLSFHHMGNRIAKHIYTDNAFTLLEKSTYYVRDASGNVMAVYDRIIDASEETGEFMLSERHIYGSSRIGMDVSTHVFGPDPYTALTETTRELGRRQYEISNHLGNVLSVITDQKLPVVDATVVVSYSAVVVTATDYSPFGVGLYGRSWSGEYRYGFQGQEKEVEQNESESTYFAQFWTYDSRTIHRFNIDPKCRKDQSSYAILLCNPVLNIDPLGDTTIVNLFSKEESYKFTDIPNTFLDSDKQPKDNVFAIFAHGQSTGIQFPDKHLAYSGQTFIEDLINISPEFKDAMRLGEPVTLLIYSCNVAATEYVRVDKETGNRKVIATPNPIAQQISAALPLESIVIAANGYCIYGRVNNKPGINGIQETNRGTDNTGCGGYIHYKNGTETGFTQSSFIGILKAPLIKPKFHY